MRHNSEQFTRFGELSLKTFNRCLTLSLLAVAFAGCGSPQGEPNAKGPGAGAKPLKIGLVFDTGGRGDKSFNDSAYAGIERAKKELGIEEKTVDSTKEADYQTNIDALAEQGCDLIIGVGVSMQKAIGEVAPKYPDMKFAIVDAPVDVKNVRSLVFKEEEGSFLAGYLAGLVTKTGKIGFVGGMDIPIIKKFESGYFAGAKTANPLVELLPAKYTGNWDNADLGKQNAKVLFGQGADIVYHAAGRAGLGVIAAAQEEKKWAIGVDGDQDGLAEGHVLTSMIKHVDVAVFQTIKDVQDGKWTPTVVTYDLKGDGVGLSPMRFTKATIGEAVLKRVQAMHDKIVSGELKVPSTADELATYLKK